MQNKPRFWRYICAAAALIAATVFVAGCSARQEMRDQIQVKVQSMSDEELVNYYHGINERIKEIDRGTSRKESRDYSEEDSFVTQQPFIFGGEGYRLEQERQAILDELSRRKIYPDDH